MSIHSVSASLSSRGLGHTVVASVAVEDSSVGLEVAIASGRIKSFDGLVSELETADDIKYAKSYKKWVEKGREGKPPRSKGKVRTAMFIRSVCHNLGI